MPVYRFTNPDTGEKIKLTGDIPPTELQLDEIFSSLGSVPAIEPKAEAAKPDELKEIQTRRGKRRVSTSPQEEYKGNPLYEGLTEENIKKIDEATKGITGRGASTRKAGMQKRMANLERVRSANPYLAEIIEEMPDYQAFAVGAGATVSKVGKGLGRIFGIIDKDDAKDEDFEALKSVKGAAGIGEAVGNMAIAAIPGSAVAKIPALGARMAAGATVGGAESALQSLGAGDDSDEVALKSVLGVVVGGAASGISKDAIVGGAKAISRSAKNLSSWSRGESAFKQDIKGLIEAGGEDIKSAKFMLNSSGKVIKDKVYSDAVKQGFDEGAAHMVKGADPATKKKMSEMLDVLVKRKKNSRWGAENRPSDIAGQSIMDRYSAVSRANKSAGRSLGSIAKSLKDKSADFSPAVESFSRSLDDMGVKIGDDLKPNFVGSDIEGIPAAEGAITRIVARMSSGGNPKAYDLHRLKKYIDENVSWGKSADGLTGSAERELKKLRGDINDILGKASPEYKAMNKAYSDTITTIKEIDRVAGGKFDPKSPNAGKFLGSLLRRVESNAQSRVSLLDGIAGLQKTVEAYGGKSFSKGLSTKVGGSDGVLHMRKFDDDVVSLSLLASEFDSVFKTSARTSLEGGVGSELRKVGRMRNAANQGVVSAAIEGGAVVSDKLRGVSEEGAIKAIRNLLKR